MKVPPEELAHREYLTPAQAARRFGRGASFWRRLFDAGELEGYTSGGDGKKTRIYRYIKTESIQRYLGTLCAARTPVPETPRQRYLRCLREVLAERERENPA